MNQHSEDGPVPEYQLSLANSLLESHGQISDFSSTSSVCLAPQFPMNNPFSAAGYSQPAIAKHTVLPGTTPASLSFQYIIHQEASPILFRALGVSQLARVNAFPQNRHETKPNSRIPNGNIVTFHHFCKLAPELRQMVWSACIPEGNQYTRMHITALSKRILSLPKDSFFSGHGPGPDEDLNRILEFKSCGPSPYTTLAGYGESRLIACKIVKEMLLETYDLEKWFKCAEWPYYPRFEIDEREGRLLYKCVKITPSDGLDLSPFIFWDVGEVRSPRRQVLGRSYSGSSWRAPVKPWAGCERSAKRQVKLGNKK